MSTTSALHWFEKTIEYAFVLQYGQELANAIPLDGDHEKAGDTIFRANAARWVLIEFKRDQGTLKSEEKKFTNYADARNELEDEGEDKHFFVYGKLSNNQHLELMAAAFWSRNPVDPIKDLLVKKGSSDPHQFARYVKRVIELKQSRSNAGGSDSPNFSVIAAVSEHGEIKALASVSECFPPKPKPKPTNAPTFRM